MLDFCYPSYNEKNLYLSKNVDLLNDSILLWFSDYFIYLSNLIKKRYTFNDYNYLMKINTDLFPLILKYIYLRSPLKIDRIKICVYFDFFKIQRNYIIIYDYICSTSLKKKEVNIKKLVEQIFKNIDLFIYHQIYKKYNKQYTLEEIQKYLESSDIEISEDTKLKHYKEPIIIKPLHYIYVFIIIFIIYLIIILALFILFLIYQNRFSN